MKRFFLLFFLIVSTNAFCLFDDQTIAPFLGPYQMKKNTSKNCPANLLLMAMCSLGNLTLRDQDNPNFIFLSFDGVNEGELITKNKKRVIKKSDVKFSENKVSSTEAEYLKHYDSWIAHETSLELGHKILKLKKSKIIGKEKTLLFDCEYQFDEKKDQQILEQAAISRSK